MVVASYGKFASIQIDKKMKLLCIEDSELLSKYLKKALIYAGHTVDTALDGETGLWMAREYPNYAVILLDIMLPNINGLDILQALRTANNECGIIMLTAKDTREDKIQGLKMGADDYLVKPFDLEELLARIEALGRRKYRNYNEQLSLGNLLYIKQTQTFFVDNTPLTLARREHKLLELFMEYPNEILSRLQIEHAIYDAETELMSNTINPSISLLRKLLKEHHCNVKIHTKRGFGYKLA